MKKLIFFMLILSCPILLSAQEAPFGSGAEETGSEETEKLYEPVRGRYRELYLGMGLEETKDALLADNYFAYRGDVEVTMFNNPNENIIDSRGTGFIERAWFQFREEKLFIIELEMSRERIDYFTIYSRLHDKYGEPDDMTPQYAAWYSEDTILSLEYPLTVKYLDRVSFEASLEESRVRDSYRETSRKEFAEEF
ncbi:MAG: hypothetical protein PQJ59_18335 [Spirochaetales bacterium]|nr:hypothetical protein [Spirochaetales bacterium]